MKSSLVQGFVGWATGAVLICAALANGSISPAATSLLSFTILLLFFVQVVRDLTSRLGGPARQALVLGGIWFFVMIWLLVQGMTGLPAAWQHPVWALAPEGANGTISAVPEKAQMAVMRLSCYAMIFWIALRSAANPERASKLIRAFALFSAGLAAYGVAVRAFGYNPFLGEEDHETLRASFYNRNSYATYAVLGALAGLTAFLQVTAANPVGETRFPLRDHLAVFFQGAWVYALCAFLCLAAVALTTSRAGGGAAVLGVFVLIWALRRKTSRRQNRLYWLVPALVIGMVLLLLGDQTLARIDNSNSDVRFVVLPHILQAIWDRPMLGHGADTFLEVFRSYLPIGANAADWRFAHDASLEVAFEFGIPAAALFLGVVLLVGVRLLRGVLTRRRSQSIPSFALACFVAAGFHSFFDFSLQIPGVAAAFAWILGIGWAQSFSEAEKAKGRIATRPSTKPHTL